MTVPAGALGEPVPVEILEVPGKKEDRQPAPPNWLDSIPEPGKDVASKPEAPDSLPNMVLGTVKMGHVIIARRTGWDGWRLDDEEAEYWRHGLRFMLKNVNPKEWPGVIAAFMIILVELNKTWGYFDWRRETGKSMPDLGGLLRGARAKPGGAEAIRAEAEKRQPRVVSEKEWDDGVKAEIKPGFR